MNSVLLLMGGFIDPKKALILFGLVLIMFGSFAAGLIFLIREKMGFSVSKATMEKTRITK